MLHKPRGIDLTQVTEWSDGESRRLDDYLVAEEPLEIRLNGAPLSVTMRTPGNDLELTAGFLLTESIIENREQIRSLEFGKTERQEASGNIVEVTLDSPADCERMQRNFFVASSCGICGKASIDAVRNRGLRPPNPEFRLDPEILCSLPDKLRSAQPIFGRTGGLHAAGLFTPAGELLCLREDVGRHNAVDKVIGWAVANGALPLAGHLLAVSGRISFEIAQKALAARIPIIAAVSAPTSLAVDLAERAGLTLVGFARGEGFNVYGARRRVSQ